MKSTIEFVKDDSLLDRGWKLEDITRGTLAVCHASPDYDNPIMVFSYYPIIPNAKIGDWEACIGREVYNVAPGLYQDSYGMKYRLTNGGQTYPCKTEKTPIPRPSRVKEAEYRHGAWYKYTKAQGWTRA